MTWYSLSVSVRAGATVMLSPVCTPMGSTFSIEHTMMQLSARSRTTSISNSFQPSTLSSTRTVLVGEASMPRSMISMYSALLFAIPPPVPPMGKEGRMMAGRPMSSSTDNASPSEPIWCERGVSSPIFVMASRNSSRSSALSMASAVAPISSTSCRSRTPWAFSASAQLSAVWPPMVGSSANPPGALCRSMAMIWATISGVMGST